MEEKKPSKLSLSTLLLILALIIIIVMACYIYLDKTNSEKKITELETNISNLQSSLDSLQEGNNNTLNNVTENNETVANDSVSFTDEQVKTTLSNYLELQAHANCDSLLENLTEKGKLNYDSSKNTVQNDGTVLTNIKFSDYKNAMLNYVSETEFEKNWNSTQHFSKTNNGYLTKIQGGGSLNVYTIKSITKNDTFNYTAKTSYIIDITETDKTYDQNFKFVVKDYNGNCVIDSIEQSNS